MKPGIASFSMLGLRGDRRRLLSYTDEDTYRDAGQGGFEIRTFVAISGATEECPGELYFYAPIPIYAVGCTVARVVLDSEGSVSRQT